jgi:hypothetical protein
VYLITTGRKTIEIRLKICDEFIIHAKIALSKWKKPLYIPKNEESWVLQRCFNQPISSIYIAMRLYKDFCILRYTKRKMCKIQSLNVFIYFKSDYRFAMGNTKVYKISKL